jgi:CRP-like cAMP-binding protein
MSEALGESSRFPRGTVLFRHGEPAEAAYVVTDGVIGLYRESQGRRVPLGTVRRGELFGEVAAVDGSPRESFAIALEDSTVTVIPRACLEAAMADADPLLKALADILGRNLRRVHETYTPKSRSLLDAVNSLSRQYETVSRFVRGNMRADLRQAFDGRMKVLDGLVKDVRRIATAHRELDRRDDAIPHEADLPI